MRRITFVINDGVRGITKRIFMAVSRPFIVRRGRACLYVISRGKIIAVLIFHLVDNVSIDMMINGRIATIDIE